MIFGIDLDVTIFAAALIFARLGGVLMLLPGIGEQVFPARVRLAFALAFAFAVGPQIAPQLPAPPEPAGAALLLVAGEAVIGIMIGAAARLFLMSAAVAGQIIAYQTGLAIAQVFDATQGQSGALTSQFLNLTFITLLFVTNTHHLLLGAAASSYEIMPAGEPPMWGDAADWVLTLFADAFIIGVQISAPLVIFGLIFYLGIGVLSKLMPQAQLFFIAMPANILLGFAVLALSLGAGALVWLGRMEEFAATLN